MLVLVERPPDGELVMMGRLDLGRWPVAGARWLFTLIVHPQS